MSKLTNIVCAITFAAVNLGGLGGCHRYIKPQPFFSPAVAYAGEKSAGTDLKKEESKKESKADLQDIVAVKLDSLLKSECDKTYITEMKGDKIIVCAEENKRQGPKPYRRAFVLNLGSVSGVYIQERNFWPFSKYVKDKLCVSTTKGEAFCYKLKVTVAAEIGSTLSYYIKESGNDKKNLLDPTMNNINAK